MTARFFFLLVAGLAGFARAQDQEKPKSEAERRAAFEAYMRDRSRWVRLGPVPDLKVRLPRKVDEEGARRIRGLIASLARIQSPDFGLSATLSGESFAPLGKGKASTLLLTNHDIEPNQALGDLVHLGSRALPFLLKALEDATPTRLEIKHDPHFGGGMWHDRELWGNLANQREQAILAKNERPKFGHRDDLKDYTVKVGDVCFVAIGQIVGRSYSAVRYQPTACIVLNSPVHSPEYRALVREMWESPDPEQALLSSLLVDYSTQGNFNGWSLDGWGVGSDLQCGAAMRLLYYFPEESAALIAVRLGKLDVTHGEGLDPFMNREVKNGVETEDFIKAVAWTSDQRIRKELALIAKKSLDPALFRAASEGAGVKEREVALQRLKEFVAALPADEGGPFGEGYYLLLSLGRGFADQARPVFESYLKKAGLQRKVTAIHVLGEIRADWAIDLLTPMLVDRSETDWSHGRICDDAASSIVAQDDRLIFLPREDVTSRDRQIEKLREELERRTKR
jgi:hypothetical protein